MRYICSLSFSLSLLKEFPFDINTWGKGVCIYNIRPLRMVWQKRTMICNSNRVAVAVSA